MDGLSKEQKEIIESIEERITELKNIKQSLIKCQKDYECACMERDMLRKQNDRLLTSMKDCVNELCIKCGRFPNNHLGACDACKWKDVKDWDLY